MFINIEVFILTSLSGTVVSRLLSISVLSSNDFSYPYYQVDDEHFTGNFLLIVSIQ